MVFVGFMLLINYLFRNSRHGRLYYGLVITALGFVFLTYVAYLILSGANIVIFEPINPDSGPTNASLNDVYNLVDTFRLNFSHFS
jgi:hypothetical protein